MKQNYTKNERSETTLKTSEAKLHSKRVLPCVLETAVAFTVENLCPLPRIVKKPSAVIRVIRPTPIASPAMTRSPETTLVSSEDFITLVLSEDLTTLVSSEDLTTLDWSEDLTTLDSSVVSTNLKRPVAV